MLVGATLGRRFTLLRPEEFDLEDVERFVAHDARLNTEVFVDVIAGQAALQVVGTAARATLVRDPRLTRILSASTDQVDGESVTYVVHEMAQGVRLDAVLARYRATPALAAAIVGELARGLAIARAAGLHHDHVRPSAVTITRSGRVVLSGLGVDGVVASQAGLTRSQSERADAGALARLYLALIAGTDADQAAPDDVPADLPASAQAFATATLEGSPPRVLRKVLEAVQPFSATVLRGFATTVRTLELRPDVARAESEARAGILPENLLVAPETLDEAASLATAVAAEHVTPFQLLDEAGAAHVLPPAPPEAAAEPGVDDLATFDAMAMEQNAVAEPSVAEALLERLHERWPQSAPLARALRTVQERATRPAPINAGPLLMALVTVIVLVAGMVAFAMIQQPFEYEGERYNHPPRIYPEFPFTPDASASPEGE